ncbi:MAG TPA: DUF3090 domain-containing protein [Anaerolineales bacterium]|nr:DUF3090 domain-containing protein [Anaerolineales bacterium]
MELDLNPVTRITTGALGPPGKRVFYLQARKDDQLVTLIVEKQQIQTLAIGLERFLGDLAQRNPALPDPSGDYKREEMSLEEPIEPKFRVGQLGLGYDESSDRVVLVARELQDETQESEVIRFWCSRSQLRAMCQWGLEVAGQGRPICGNCGEPKDPQGHFCPKSNGHKL